jgi:uncharacterized membrane protein
MRRLVSTLLLIVLLVAPACHGVDRLFEGPVPPDARLALSLQSIAVTVAQGSEQTLTVSVNRLGDFSGDVVLAVEDVPAGVTATVSGASTVGSVTTSTLSIRVASGTSTGQHVLTVRARANQLPDVTARLTLVVAEAPAFSMTASQSALSIIRGGVAPLAVSLARTNLTSPVALSVAGAPGLSATFTPNPVTGDAADGTISVASDVAPGTYTLSVRATAPGVVERTASVALTVPADATQLIAPAELTTAQGTGIDTRIIINRAANVGAVTLSAENLPAGVTPSFQPGTTTTSATTTLSLTVAPTAVAGSYPVTIRAKAAGVPDATADLRLTITAVSVALSIDPASVSVFPGGAAALSTVTLARVGFSGPVSLAAEGMPAGLTVTPEVAAATGSTIGITTTAAASATPGQYAVTIRATPVGFPSSASRTATLNVAVRAAPTGSGNVLLDWSSCAAPDWIAFQDGTGPWTQVVPSGGFARFNVTSGRGAFAYVESRNKTVVSYRTQAELTAGPITMCPAPSPTKTIVGTALHTTTSANEQATYYLGGGIGASTGAAPSFTIRGVAEGKHDLVGWAAILGARGLIQRDIDLPDGGSVGAVNWSGPGSFTPQRATLNILGFLGDVTGSHGMSYLTTTACSESPFYSGAGGAMFGVPESLQRESDFHLVTIVAATTAGARTRTARTAFHTMSDRSVSLPPALSATPAIVTLPGSYRRLQATFGDIPAVYNGSAGLEYGDGTKTMSVSASIASTGLAAVAVAMPDFSGVSGWQTAFAIPGGASGTSTASLDGGTSTGSLCAEGERRISIRYRGAF